MQYFFFWEEESLYCVFGLHIEYCKEQNGHSSPHNLVIAPFYKVNSSLVLLCTNEIADVTLHLIINYMSH